MIIVVVVFGLLWTAAILFTVTSSAQDAGGDFATYIEAANALSEGEAIYEVGQWEDQVNYRYHPVFLFWVQGLMATGQPVLVQTLVNLICLVYSVFVARDIFKKDKRLGTVAYLIAFWTVFNSSMMANIGYGNVNSILILLTLLAVNEMMGKQRGWLVGVYMIPAMVSKPQWALALGVFVFVGILRFYVEKDRSTLKQATIAIGTALGAYLLINVAFGTLFPNGWDYLRSYVEFTGGVDANYAYELQYPSDQNHPRHVAIMLNGSQAGWIDFLNLALKAALLVNLIAVLYALVSRKVRATPFVIMYLTGLFYLTAMNLLPEFQEVVWAHIPYLVLMASGLSKKHKLLITVWMVIWAMTALFNFPGIMISESYGESGTLMDVVLFYNRWFPVEGLTSWLLLGYLSYLPWAEEARLVKS